MVVKVRAIYQAVFENRWCASSCAPCRRSAETLMLGKILHEARSEQNGRPRWDLVVVDAPATGHAVQAARRPPGAPRTVPGGRSGATRSGCRRSSPTRRAPRWRSSPSRGDAVTETSELDVQIGEGLKLPRGPVFLTPCRCPVHAGRTRTSCVGSPPPGHRSDGRRSAVLQAEQQERARHRRSAARAPRPAPVLPLRLLAADRWGDGPWSASADAMDGQV